MASGLSKSAKQQTWPREERERQLLFVKGAIQMLTGARDVLDRNGKLLRVGSPGRERMPRTALRFLRENGVTMVFPRERKTFTEAVEDATPKRPIVTATAEVIE